MRREVAYEKVSGTLASGRAAAALTDGLPEAPTPAGEPLGYERFEEILARAGRSGPEALCESVRLATSPTLADDWTILVLERTA